MSAQVHRITPRGHRTPEQIREQLEARMAELEREAQKPERVYPCNACRWARGSFCDQPLVMGIGKALIYKWDRENNDGTNRLCGPEKALWEPIPTRWQRFTEWLSRMIERAEGRAINKGDR